VVVPTDYLHFNLMPVVIINRVQETISMKIIKPKENVSEYFIDT